MKFPHIYKSTQYASHEMAPTPDDPSLSFLAISRKMSGHITFEKMYLIEHEVLILSAGVLAGSIIAGGLAVLGIFCFLLLSSDIRVSRKQRILFQAYIIILTIVVIGIQISYFFCAHAIGLFHPHSFAQKYEDIFATVRWSGDLLPLVVVGMTDGLFVSRIAFE